jgi:hypothetical protein
MGWLLLQPTGGLGQEGNGAHAQLFISSSGGLQMLFRTSGLI